MKRLRSLGWSAVLVSGLVACGSASSEGTQTNAGAASDGNAGATTQPTGNAGAPAASGGLLNTAGTGPGSSAAGSSGTNGASGGAGGASANAGQAGAANGGSAGSSAGQAGAANGGAAPATDYPYCNYGTVPSGTAQVWNDTPTLTPIGLNPYGAPALTVAQGYILLNEGAQGVTQVPQDTQTAILKRINDDLKFESGYSSIHLPPWATSATNPHYIDYLFVGTGLPKDPNAGGDSSWEGQYPNVETTQVAMTDASQRYDLTHEFNHVLENSYGTIPGDKVSWLQESYNDYLILLTAEHANGGMPGQNSQFTLPGNVGYLDSLVYTQPYVPIESCGIAAQDASAVNGPGDYFTDITAYRYNDLFPLFVAQRVGQHFFAAVWEQAKQTEQVLQTMTRLLDRARVQCMVGEYAARLALGDFAELSSSLQKVAGDPGMFTVTTTQDGWLVPSSAAKLPRYTGRNNIAIAVTTGATQVSVKFAPDPTGSKGTAAQLQLQLAYRAIDGSVVFGAPVTTGSALLALSKAPKNNVVIAVISNLTLDGYKTAKAYGWDPNETFGYKLQITGGTPAATNKTYF